jgi:hypothetical protein
MTVGQRFTGMGPGIVQHHKYVPYAFTEHHASSGAAPKAGEHALGAGRGV